MLILGLIECIKIASVHCSNYRVTQIREQFTDRKEYQDFASASLQDIIERKKLYKEMESLLLE